MRLCIDHALECISVVAVLDSSTHGIHVPVKVTLSLHRAANRMNKHRVPLRVKASASRAGVLSEPIIRRVVHILSDLNLPRLNSVDLVIAPLHQ